MNNVIVMDTTTVLKNNFMPYSAYVILDRALPEIDGFKPSQRRILYTMFKMGLLKGARKKSQGVVGQTMFLHPHGDGAIYETLVRMSRDAESLLVPYIDSKGNFGKQYSRDMQYASARYTEVRLEAIAKELFIDIDKDTVDMIDNYDGEMKEPRLLPVSFPTILVNPQNGTAVGMGTGLASFNINEVIDFVIAYIKNPKVSVADYILAPDFPTGGNIVYDRAVLDNILNNGSGSVQIRSKYHVDGDTITFTEIPYSTTYEAIVDKIVELVKEGKIKEITDIHDKMGINGQGIEITVKKNTDKQLFIEKLFKMTPLQASYSCNSNLIINGRPQVLGVKQIVHEWLQFRVKTIKRGAEFDIRKKQHKRHMLLALKQVILDIDRAIAIVRGTKNNSETTSKLMEAFGIDEEQAEFVSEIKLRHLNKDYLVNRIEEISNLEKEIEDLQTLINDKKTMAKLIISQLQDVKKNYGQERKTDIIEVKELPKAKAEAVQVDNYNVKIFVSKEGYLKKIPLTSLRGNFDIKVKDGDEIVREIETTNNSDILIFTDKQNVYKYKAYDLEDSKPSLLGEYLPSLLELKDEEIQFVTVTNDYKGFLIVGFEDGKVAKIDLSAYETKQNRSMLKNAYADKRALYFNHIHEDIDVFAVSSIDKGLLFNTSMINPKTSKTTIGVQVMKSKNDSVVASYRLPKDGENLEYYRTAGAGIGKYLK
jgi:DNA gyrase subunit A